MTSYAHHNTIFIDLLGITLPKPLVKFQSHPNKVRKSAKNALIMLINPS